VTPKFDRNELYLYLVPFFFSKRLPKDAPEGCPQSLMGAIKRALRNASNRKGKYILEPTPGMTFDCVSEAQEFYNIYSWEVGFGTKKGDKYGKSMQEFQCQRHVRKGFLSWSFCHIFQP
jgi:hypothetical protein